MKGLGKVRYRTEISPPKQSPEKLGERLARFGERFKTATEAGFEVCITDNAMGRLCFQGNELLEELSLAGCQAMVHLNTFHSLTDLHWILESCAKLGVKELLIVSGDGAPRLPKLKPSEVGGSGAAATSVELLAYVKRNFGGCFTLGAAFNQYEPESHETEKLKRKLDAGAEFIITQPVIGRHAALDSLLKWLPVPMIVEAWMSPKLELLKDCVGYDPGAELSGPFDPLACLREVERNYPDCGVYLALLDLKSQLPEILKGDAL